MFPAGLCGSLLCFGGFVELVKCRTLEVCFNFKTTDCMIDVVVHDVKGHVERSVSSKTDGLKELLSGVLSCCAKETSAREGSDALKVLLSGMETRFRADHAALVDATNAHTMATKTQTRHLEVLCKAVQSMNKKKDVLFSQTAH